MNILKKLLLFTCISPIILVILISSLNINKTVRLKFLTWTTPSLSIGLIMTISSLTSGLLSASSIIIINNEKLAYKRQVHIDPNNPYNKDYNRSEDEIFNSNNQYDIADSEFNYIPERDIRDPSPTVSVPFRIINQPIQPKDIKNQSSNINTDEKYYESEYEYIEKETFSDNYEDSYNDSNIEEIDPINQNPIDSSEQWGDPIGENW